MLPELDPLLLASSSKRSIPPGQTKHYRGVRNRQVYTAFARFRKTANHASRKIAPAYFAPAPDLKAYARVVGYSCRGFCPCRSQNSILRLRDRKSDAGTKKKHHPRKDHHFNSPCKPPPKKNFKGSVFLQRSFPDAPSPSDLATTSEAHSFVGYGSSKRTHQLVGRRN